MARFWFTRPGDNQVSVGPLVVAQDELVVRGACRSYSGMLTWKVFDNGSEADTGDDVPIVDQGGFTCDGTTQEASARVGSLTELAILGVAGTGQHDDGESAWLTLANE